MPGGFKADHGALPLMLPSTEIWDGVLVNECYFVDRGFAGWRQRE